MFQRTGFASEGIKFVVFDKIRCYNDDQNSNNIIFVSNLGNGLITNLQNSSISISWDSGTIDNYDISDFANFNYNSYKICVKIGDFWEDKDNNRYNDAGIKQ